MAGAALAVWVTQLFTVTTSNWSDRVTGRVFLIQNVTDSLNKLMTQECRACTRVCIVAHTVHIVYTALADISNGTGLHACVTTDRSTQNRHT